MFTFFSSERRGKLCRSLLVAIALLTLLETGARFLLFRLGNEALFLEYASIRQKFARSLAENEFLTFHPFLVWAPREGTWPWIDGTIRINSRGFRGEEVLLPKPEGEFRIACLGGSTTLDEEVLNEMETYPASLQEELRRLGYKVSVINAGCSNYASDQTLINYAVRVSHCDPDLVVLNEGINDWLRRFQWPPEMHRADASGADGVRGLIAHELTPVEILGSSVFLRMLLTNCGLPFPDYGIHPIYVSIPKTYVWEYWEQIVMGTYPDGFFKEVDAGTILATNRPVNFEHNVKNIIDLVRGNGVGIMMSTVTGSPEWSLAKKPQAEWWVKGLEEMNEVTKRIGAEKNVPVFDFATAMPKDETAWSDPMHCNGKGSSEKGRLFARFIVESGLIPESFKVK